jgi:hypothetical protein
VLAPSIVTQLAVVATDQGQSRVVVIVTVPGPPDASNDVGVLLALTWHLSMIGVVGDVCVVDVHAAATPTIAIPNATAPLFARIVPSRNARCTALAKGICSCDRRAAERALNS